MVRETYCRPSGAWPVRWCWRTHGLRRGLPAVAAPRLGAWAVAESHGLRRGLPAAAAPRLGARAVAESHGSRRGLPAAVPPGLVIPPVSNPGLKPRAIKCRRSAANYVPKLTLQQLTKRLTNDAYAIS